jgi:hypothetical protein
MVSLAEQLETVAYFPNGFSAVLICFTLLIGIIAVIGSGLILIANFGKHNSESTRILLSISLADWFFSMTILITNTRNILSGGFAWGIVGCHFNAFANVMGATTSVNALTAAALERYLAVCKGIILTERQVKYLVAGIWLYSIFYSATPYWSNQPNETIAVEPPCWSCATRWWGRSWGALVGTILGAAAFTIDYTIIFFSYYSVYVTFSSAGDKSTKSGHNLRAKLKKQHQVFVKCIMMTGSFVIFWTPYSAKIVYELITGVPTNVYWSTIASFFAISTTAVNQIIMIKYDNRVRGYVMELLGFKSTESYSAPSAPHETATATSQSRMISHTQHFAQTQPLDTVKEV